MPFITKLDAPFLPDGRRRRLNKPLIWRDPLTGEEYGPPAGEVSNGASSKWWMWWWFPPWGVWERAVFLHDWLYRVKWFCRLRSDWIFLQAMASDLVVLPKRVAAFIIVCVFGGPYWRDA